MPPLDKMFALGTGAVFRIGEGRTAEFAFSVPNGAEDTVWCSCPDFRLDDACIHIDAVMLLPPELRGR